MHFLFIDRLQNSRIFWEHERRIQYSIERSGASVEMRIVRFTREDHAYGASRFPNSEKTTVLPSNSPRTLNL